MGKKTFYAPTAREEVDVKETIESFEKQKKNALEFLDGKELEPIDTTPIKSFEPFGRKILVVMDNGERETKGGIVIPVSNGEKQITGVVVGVGKDAVSVILGDRVLFPHHRGIPIKLEGRDILIMDEKDDVVGKLKIKKDEPSKRIVN